MDTEQKGIKIWETETHVFIQYADFKALVSIQKRPINYKHWTAKLMEKLPDVLQPVLWPVSSSVLLDCLLVVFSMLWCLSEMKQFCTQFTLKGRTCFSQCNKQMVRNEILWNQWQIVCSFLQTYQKFFCD